MSCSSEDKKIKIVSRSEHTYPGLPVLHFTTVLPLLTYNGVLSAMNMEYGWGGGGGVGVGCQCIKFSHHGSFWLHIFLQLRNAVKPFCGIVQSLL
jgi:hypothetical protein